jgi:hypothetical protein
MVNARLHVICGNCGCLATNERPDDLFFQIHEKGHDYGDYQLPAVYITCRNCSTIHDLSETVKEKEE